MSGHSKWAQIRRSKGVNDARRGQLFTRLGREITVAVRQGGPDPDANFRLRIAVQKARDNNMPLENIERSIKRASGTAEGNTLEEIVYEGYGPGGTAILVQTMTDNRQRTVAEVRNTFNKHAGNMGESGCVDWLFESKGILHIALTGKDPDEVSLEAIDAGADDVVVNEVEGLLEVYTDSAELDKVRKTLEAKTLKILKAETDMIAKTTIALEEKAALQAMKLIERLEDLDDVQNVYTNADIAPEIAEKYEG